MKVVHNQTGKVHEVDEQTAQAGLQSGEFALKKGQTVDIVDSKTGDLKKIAADALGSEFSMGNEIASAEFARRRTLEEKHKGLGDFAKGVGEGLASGATFGLSDLAIAKSSEENRIAAAERAELRPGVRMGSEIAGAALPMVFSGGTGAVAKGAALAPTSLVGRAGALAARGAEAVVGTGAESLLGRVAQKAIPMAAQGALEGAAYGAGQVVSENALGGHEITAEKLLAGAEHGMFLGGAVGGGVGVLGELGKAAASKAFKFANESSLKDWLQEIADKSTLKAVGLDQRQFNRLGHTAEEKIGRVADIAETVRTAKLQDGTKVFQPFKTATELGENLVKAEAEAGTRLAKVIDKIDDVTHAMPDAKPDFVKALNRVESEIAAPLRTANVPQLTEQAGLIDKTLSKIKEKVQATEAMGALDKQFNIGFKEGREILKDLDAAIYDTKATSVGLPGLPNPRLQKLEQVRGIINDEIEKAADKAAQMTGDEVLAGAYQAEKRTWRDLHQAKKMSEAWEAKDFGNRWVSPTDYMGAMQGGMAALGGGLGGIGAMASSALGGIAHNVIRERGQSVVAHVADRIANLNALSQVTAGVDQKIASGVRDALRGELSRAATQISESPRQKAFDKVVDKVATVVADPVKANDLVAQKVGALANHAPGVAAAAANVVAADMKYVADSMPSSVKAHQMVAGPKRVPTSEIHRVEKMIKTIEAPLTILSDIKQGRATASQSQALRDRRPQIVEQIKTEIMTEMAGSQRIPSFKVRQQLSTLIGKPVDFETSPAFKQSIQQIYAPPQQQQGGGAPSPKPTRRPATKLASNQFTYSQKLNFE